jgi:cobyrinic acid a,c-diamide synthase
MESNDIFLAVAVGIAAGFGMIILYAVYLYYKLKSRIDEMIQEVIAEHEANMVGLDIELDNDVYFCYNNTDKQFICQGASVVEVAQAFRSRYPTKTAYLAGGEPEVLARFRAELDKMRAEVNEVSNSQ